jgi:tRNA (cmo5U34)-methyltransferase
VSVAQHLGIRLPEYDRVIRTFIPWYAELLRVVAGGAGVVRRKAPRILDLGIGTGALSARCLAMIPGATVYGIDADPQILEAARRRLARYGNRVHLERADFVRASLPPCGAIVATLALHHILSPAAKGRFYRRCYRALSRGGVLVSGDAFVSDDPVLATRDLEPWRRHMHRSYTTRQTEQFLSAWSGEDRYLSIARELRLLEDSGFRSDVVWRRPPFAVIVGRKALRTPASRVLRAARSSSGSKSNKKA